MKNWDFLAKENILMVSWQYWCGVIRPKSIFRDIIGMGLAFSLLASVSFSQ